MSSAEQIYREFETFSATSADLRFYALINHGGMPGLVQQLTQTKHDWRNLFQGSTEENAMSVAPIVLPLERNPTSGTGQRMLKWIAEHGTYSSSVLLLASPLGMEALARRLASRLDAVLPGNINVMLRYFDTRVFAELMAVLDAAQKAAFLSPASQWWYVDRRGALQSVPATFASHDPWTAPVALDMAQQNSLIDASEPDQIAELLQSSVPDEYGQLPRQDRYDFIVRHSQAAQGFGIKTTHEKSFYCALALMYGEDFASQPVWKNGLTHVQAGTLTLKKLVEQIEEKSE